jgi:dopamine D1-like receptor
MNDSTFTNQIPGYGTNDVHTGSVHMTGVGSGGQPIHPYTEMTMATTHNFNDVTGTVDDVTLSSRYGLEERTTIGVILSVIIFFSVGGNVLVCVAIVTERTLRKTSNYFIISLAIADMLVAILVMTFAVANDIMGYWVFGGTFCDIWISSDVMCSTASILNLCAISLDRYIHIRSPLHYERWVTRKRTLLAIMAMWLLSALISFLPIHLGWHELGLERDVTDDANDVITNVSYGQLTNVTRIKDKYFYTCMLELNPLYAVLSSMVSFYIPCIVMILIYFKMYQYARMHVKSIRKSMAAGMVNHISTENSGTTPSGDNHPPPNRLQYKMADHKAAITLGVIMGVFLFCWVPFFTINIIGAFCPSCIPPIVFSIFTWLGYLNSTMNPVIYSIFNTEFRDAFKRVLTFAKCRNEYHRRHGTFDYGKPIRTNGTPSYTVDYGAVPSTRKLSEARLMPDKITSV